jgi:glucose uptake protein
MYQPETYLICLVFMLISMLCWGSWANTVKLCPGYRFQLFYWDYVLGLILGALAWGLTLGSMGSSGKPFLWDMSHASRHTILLAVTGGVIFNIANLLLVAAIDIAGLAVAFPVGIGLALIVGAASSYVLSPQGNPLLLFGGIALVVAAIVCDAIAYRLRDAKQQAMSSRGLIISLIAGLLMGTFYPFVSKAMSGAGAPGPYAAVFYFSLGVAACAVPVNYLLMRLPLDELSRGAGAHGWPGGLLLHRPGGDDDLGGLGRFYLERICRGTIKVKGIPGVDVCPLPLWANGDCGCASFLALRAPAD